jgi:hypothetical protein
MAPRELERRYLLEQWREGKAKPATQDELRKYVGRRVGVVTPDAENYFGKLIEWNEKIVLLKGQKTVIRLGSGDRFAVIE